MTTEGELANSGVFASVNSTGQIIYGTLFITCTKNGNTACSDNMAFLLGDNPPSSSVVKVDPSSSTN